MGIELIEVRKISKETKKTDDGSHVKNPSTRREIKDDKFVVEIELIRIDEIKAVKAWDKTMEQHAQIEGPMTVIYLKGDGIRTTTPKLFIEEDLNSFAKRSGTIRLIDGKEHRGE